MGYSPIDGIFISDGILIEAGGYFAFGTAILSNRQALWIDINVRQVLGDVTPPIFHANARRLQCRDPRIVQKYNSYDAK